MQALADPTRRRIVELLAAGDRSAGELVAEFPMSQPGVSRHLRILREAGVVDATRDAQRRIYRLRPETLDEVGEWIEACRRTWSNRLDALETELYRGARARSDET